MNLAEREEEQIDVITAEDAHNYSEVQQSQIQHNHLQEETRHLNEEPEESTQILEETAQIDLKCAEMVTDSDVDDVEDYKAHDNHQTVRICKS